LTTEARDQTPPASPQSDFSPTPLNGMLTYEEEKENMLQMAEEFMRVAIPRRQFWQPLESVMMKFPHMSHIAEVDSESGGVFYVLFTEQPLLQAHGAVVNSHWRDVIGGLIPRPPTCIARYEMEWFRNNNPSQEASPLLRVYKCMASLFDVQTCPISLPAKMSLSNDLPSGPCHFICPIASVVTWANVFRFEDEN
jgi:hypothetical protein